MKSFKIRVYGILINNRNKVLVSDEYRNGYSFTKFPGGGLEFGEGLIDGLKREFKEEMGITIDVGNFFYVNDFHQVSAFNENHQILSFYYFVSYPNWKNIKVQETHIPLLEEGERQRWIVLNELSADNFTFPIDKIVAGKLANL